MCRLWSSLSSPARRLLRGEQDGIEDEDAAIEGSLAIAAELEAAGGRVHVQAVFLLCSTRSQNPARPLQITNLMPGAGKRSLTSGLVVLLAWWDSPLSAGTSSKAWRQWIGRAHTSGRPSQQQLPEWQRW